MQNAYIITTCVRKILNMQNPVDPAVLEEITKLLSYYFHTKIHVHSMTSISEPERRNLILRIYIQGSSEDIPKSIIFKQACLDMESDHLARFSRDWAGLEFLNRLEPDCDFIPKFYGGSVRYRFILVEDLGETHKSLVDVLTAPYIEDAKKALEKFMFTMGQLHARGYGKTDIYKQILERIDVAPDSWEENLNQNLTLLEALFKQLDLSLSNNLKKEINHVFKANLTPGPFTTLIHGDICPDNIFDNREKNAFYFIDFEWCFVRNALLDGTYLRMSFPTCWCAKAIPKNLIDSLEISYRVQLQKTIPAAKNDDEYFDAYVNACAFWMLKSLLLLNDVLPDEIIWPSDPTPPQSLWQPKENRVRPRILSRLIAFVEIANEHKKLPYLSSTCTQILDVLASRWPHVKSLGLYPPFN